MKKKVDIGRTIQAKNISDAWYKGLDLIWNKGNIEIDERNEKLYEFLNLIIVIEDPNVNKMPEIQIDKKYLEEYAKQLVMGTGEQQFKYTYGQRLRNWNNQVDQIAYVIEKLKKENSSRRATAVTWLPLEDVMADEVPCMIIDDFKIREGKVHLTTLFRSHDFVGAYPANLYGLSKLLEYVAEKVGVPSGTITTISISAHICERDWSKIEELLEKEK